MIRPSEILEAFSFHEATALEAGVSQYFVSTIPRIGSGPNLESETANRLLRDEFPGRFFESFEGFVIDEDFGSDGYHFNEMGQRKRAARAFEWIGPR